MSDGAPKAYEADHTALVHVLWAAKHQGLSLDDADALASFVRSSDYHDAAGRQAVAQFARGLLGPRTDDLVLTPQVGVYLAEAEKVGGRSTWAMRYADEAHAHAGAARRLDRFTTALHDAAREPA
ncbi:hypothetical protein [Cellulosimicrobium sp. Marseille-Q4280]|uniref:hypothetical protein n=1 Tax=Cellulosimicrobium sp. Marseille-Q4280 TaxID=2937992 RepID=UPI00203ACD4A|nr:hypothetical protein [Cellulosimicrobium sp. Marseille-Q4280]